MAYASGTWSLFALASSAGRGIVTARRVSCANEIPAASTNRSSILIAFSSPVRDMESRSPQRHQLWLDGRRARLFSEKRRLRPKAKSEYFFNEMSRLDACFFRVVDGNLGRLLRTLADVLASILRRV